MSTPTTSEGQVPSLESSPDKYLKEAISLKSANCYGALAFANALGGSPTLAWILCHAYTLKQMLAEVTRRNLDLTGVLSSVDNTPVQETMYFRRAAGTMTEDEFQAAFTRWKNNE